MSPTILRELLRIQTQVRAGDEANWYFGNIAYNAPGVRELPHGSVERRAAAKRVLRDPSRLLRAELPERRYHEEMEVEHLAQLAAGGRTICPNCGERSVRGRDVYTLGYAGHPGAEISVYECCERDNCDYASL